MLQDIVSIGDKIEIRQLDQRGEVMKSSKTYVSQMIDFAEDNKIVIATPIKNGLIVLLEKWVNYRLYFYTVKGLYQVDCTMLQTYREGKNVLSLVNVISEAKKIQRRKYYRLEYVHEIEYRLVTEEETLLEERLLKGNVINPDEKAEIRKRLAELNRVWNKAAITDLSGGGCRFNAEQKLERGNRIRIKLDFILKNELKKLDLLADIIDSQQIFERKGVYESRAEFYNILPKDREDLIKYIFEQERRLRKNDMTT
jgi:c-di-GMP-binding flagellar brake protein YcgR